MKRKLLALFVIMTMLATLLAGCAGESKSSSGRDKDKTSERSDRDDDDDDEEDDDDDEGGKSLADLFNKNDKTTSKGNEEKVINVMSFTDEVPGMVQRYLDMHPELGYTMRSTIVATTDGMYQPALDEMLKGSYGDSPDIYALEAAFVLKYTQGDASGFAAAYDELGIETNRMIRESKTARYAVEIGTRPTDGRVVALPYQSTAGCFIYRRSIAKDTWGTDDPATIQQIIGGGSGNWDQFWGAAQQLRRNGYAIISGDGDIWHAIENSADQAWIVDGRLTLDPKRESLLDISKMLTDNDWSNKTQDWQDAWFADMKGEGQKEVFGFFGPAWLINYTMSDNCGDYPDTWEWEGTYGDWAVCNSPVGFSWGGTYIASGKEAVNNMSSEKREVVADIIQWITLDYDVNSLQYMWANGTFYDGYNSGVKETVVSGRVMEISDGSNDFLGGQNMFEYYVPANDYATGRNLTQYDEIINMCWRDAVRSYANGYVSRSEAVAQFADEVYSRLGITIPDAMYREEDWEDEDWDDDDWTAGWTPYPTPIPMRDLGGMELIIGDHWSPEEPEAPRNAREEATMKYREEIFAKYNFTMQSKTVAGWGEMTDTCVNSISAGEPAAQLFTLDYRFVAKPMEYGLFYDLATLDELDFSEDKWNKAVLGIMTKGNSIYGMSANKSEPRGGVVWNKRLFEEAGLDPDLPYDLQASGDWTWSKFEELCAKLTRDVNSDGVTDIYATVSQGAQTMTCLVASTGSDYFGKDADGNLNNNMGSREVLDAINFAVELYNKGYEMPQPEDSYWDYFIPAFQEGMAAMQFTEEYMCMPGQSYGDYMEDAVGFVMPPKPDGADTYHSYVCDNITIIPSCYDSETAGNIAFAYNLYTMATPGYDDPDLWLDQYYSHFEDERAVDETIAMFNDGVSTHFLTQTLVPADLGPDLLWVYPFTNVTPADQIAAIKDSWDAILAEVNQNY